MGDFGLLVGAAVAVFIGSPTARRRGVRRVGRVAARLRRVGRHEAGRQQPQRVPAGHVALLQQAQRVRPRGLVRIRVALLTGPSPPSSSAGGSASASTSATIRPVREPRLWLGGEGAP